MVSQSYPYIARGLMEKGAGFTAPYFMFAIKSSKTHKTYYVYLEKHKNNFYALKFCLKDHRKYPTKFSINTNLNEARPLIYTCIRIILDFFKKHPEASFGLIGSASKQEVVNGNIQKLEHPEEKPNTKRYRVYRKLITTFFSEQHFIHQSNEKNSTYILLNRNQSNINKNLLVDILDYFEAEYDFSNQ